MVVLMEGCKTRANQSKIEDRQQNIFHRSITHPKPLQCTWKLVTFYDHHGNNDLLHIGSYCTKRV